MGFILRCYSIHNPARVKLVSTSNIQSKEGTGSALGLLAVESGVERSEGRRENTACGQFLTWEALILVIMGEDWA